MTIESFSIITWKFFNQLAKKFLKVNFITLDKYINYLSNEGVVIKWYRLENWEDLDDEDIYDRIENLNTPEGKLYVITEVCYKKGNGPFEIDAADIRGFIVKHIDKYGECFFNGDAIIFSFKKDMAWCFHHEGMYCLIPLS